MTDHADSKALRVRRGLYLLLAIATFVAFEPVLHNDFIDYDDGLYVTENAIVQSGLTRDNIKWAFTTDYNGNWHPLTWLSHMLDCQLFGLNPSLHHLSSLLLHIANSLLLFAILNAMTAALWRSAFVAAAFALHPIHVESVAWVAERKDVLSTLFWLLTMLAYLRYVRRPNAASYLLTLAAFALGLMSKAMLVTMPFVLLLLDYWPLKRIERLSFSEAASRRTVLRLALEKLPFLILSAACSVVTFQVQRSGEAVMPLSALSIPFRLANAVFSYLRYIGKIFWPTDLAAFYPLQPDELSLTVVLVSVGFLLVVSFVVVRMARARGYLPVGWFWFLGTLVPVIGIVQVGGQALADRYAYVPSIGIFIVVAWGAVDLLGDWKFRREALSITSAAILLVLLIATRTQASYWQSSITLYEHALSVTENNWLAHYNLGRRYQVQSNPLKAIENYLEALRLQPEDADVHNNLGMLLRGKGDLDEAVAHFRRAIELNPRSAGAHSNLGRTLQMQGNLPEAIRLLETSIELEPNQPERYNSLALACLQSNRIEEAVAAALHAGELTRFGEPRFLDTLAAAYAARGDFARASETATRAQRLAEGAGNEELARVLREHARAYQRGRLSP